MRRTGLLVLALTVSLQAQEVRRAVPLGPEAPVPSIPIGVSFDETAKYLAGFPISGTSSLAQAQQEAAYRTHATKFESMWARYNEYYFSRMRAWSLAELSPRLNTTLPVIYFFGGPDALAPLALYPMAPDFILGGLEPVGNLPAVEAMDSARRLAALEGLRASTDVILSFGHFITKEMKEELARTEFQGVLPLLLTFLAMKGDEVVDVAFFGIGPDGQQKEFGLAPASGPGILPGVRVAFRSGPGAPVRRLHYVQANVADDVLRSNAALLTWASGFGTGNMYFKAASYLLHEAYFSTIRTFLLERAASVLQDDSGMPLRFFQGGSWRLWFFGSYSGTLDLFRKYYQPELAQAFATGAAPLPFGTGYKWRVGESNLLLAVKQTILRAEPVMVAPVAAPTAAPLATPAAFPRRASEGTLDPGTSVPIPIAQ